MKPSKSPFSPFHTSSTASSKGTKERGYIVSWAPQEEVLAHAATGGFLTHSGWSSTLESIVEGKPMICWPYFADQHVSSRYVICGRSVEAWFGYEGYL
ncbi:hypothetical protein ACS0TY_000939 [Phlomoides rotata]